MKILFISSATKADYQCDMLFHGLRRMFGDEVVDVKRLDYMYEGYFDQPGNLRSSFFKKGFSLYGLLEDENKVDRSDIRDKIKNRYFDLVIYGSIRRCQSYLLDELFEYDAKHLVFIDGEDNPLVLNSLLNRGFYFKRELIANDPALLPIHFAIPADKISRYAAEKTKETAFIDPRDTSTYVYDNEQDYYADYGSSLFGVTMKKGGWDCLRHYEIMANQCIPLFIDIDKCPARTMTRLPKYEFSIMNAQYLKNGGAYFLTSAGLDHWRTLQAALQQILMDKLTTTALAKYVIDICMMNNK